MKTPGICAEAKPRTDPERLRAVLAPRPAEPDLQHFGDDGAVHDEQSAQKPPIPAAILFPIIPRLNGQNAGFSVLLTQRTLHLKDHAGQISFPGGRVEADDRDAADTALREAEEEIGLARSHVEIIGYLPQYRTITGFCITPVVALVHPPFTLSIDPREVAEAFEVPLEFLLDRRNHQQHSLVYQGKLRHYHAMPYDKYYIWGATAGMILSLLTLLENRFGTASPEQT